MTISCLFTFILLLMMAGMNRVKGFSALIHSTLVRRIPKRVVREPVSYFSTAPSTPLSPPVLFATPPKRKPVIKAKVIEKPQMVVVEQLPEVLKPIAKPIPKELPSLDPLTVTDEEFLFISKIVRKIKAPKKLFTFIEDCQKAGTLNWNRTMIAMKNYEFMNRTDLIKSTYQLFTTLPNAQEQIQANLNVTQQTIHFLCKAGQMKIATEIATQVGVFAYTPDTTTASSSNSHTTTKSKTITQVAEASEKNEGMGEDDMLLDQSSTKTREELFATILTDLAFGHAMTQNYKSTILTLRKMQEYNFALTVENIEYRLLSTFLADSSVYMVRDLLTVLLQLNNSTLSSDYNSLKQLTNYMVRNIEFIKGAVSVSTLPESKYPEIIFMGRSNVGKSSLINLITNRKKLAYTSKMAGKTTEFNYFLSKGEFGNKKNKTNHQDLNFYLVDLPGVGYAKRSKDLREKWKKLMNDYIHHRSDQLKCVFHLIDSRHGILDSDYDCFDLLSILPPQIDYVIVFTKTDKFSMKTSVKYYNGVSREIIAKTKEELTRLTEGKREIPMLYTSSTNRDGGIDVLAAILNRITQVEHETEEGR